MQAVQIMKFFCRKNLILLVEIQLLKAIFRALKVRGFFGGYERCLLLTQAENSRPVGFMCEQRCFHVHVYTCHV